MIDMNTVPRHEGMKVLEEELEQDYRKKPG